MGCESMLLFNERHSVYTAMNVYDRGVCSLLASLTIHAKRFTIQKKESTRCSVVTRVTSSLLADVSPNVQKIILLRT